MVLLPFGLQAQVGVALLVMAVSVMPLGKVSITSPSVTYSFDTAKLNNLLADLVESHPEIAAQLVKARKTTERAGSLRIEQEKTT